MAGGERGTGRVGAGVTAADLLGAGDRSLARSTTDLPEPRGRRIRPAQHFAKATPALERPTAAHQPVGEVAAPPAAEVPARLAPVRPRPGGPRRGRRQSPHATVAAPRRGHPPPPGRPTPPDGLSPRQRPQPIGVEVGLGLVWAAATVAAVYRGPVWLAIWLAPVAALAAASTLRSWGGGPRQPRAGLVAAVVSATITLAGVAGLWAAAVAALIGAGVVAGPALFNRRPTGAAKDGPGAWRRLAIVIAPAAGCAGAVVARTYGLDQALVLIGMVCIYDSAAYLIGTGANNAWEGPIAGVASIGALTLLVAAVFFTPFRGNSPWILGALAAVLAPLGPVVARRFTPDGAVRVPPLRRLDSLVLLGPAWVVGVSVLLHH